MTGVTPPYVVSLDGRQVALVGYVVKLPGHGTTPPTVAVEIDAVNTQAKRLWSIVTPLAVPVSYLTSLPWVTFVGSSGADVVVVVSDNNNQYPALVFDLAARKLLWSSSTFSPVAVAGDIVVGTLAGAGDSPSIYQGEGTLAGLNVQTGRTVWKSGERHLQARGQQAGPSTVLVSAFQQTTADVLLDLVNATSGKENVVIRDQNTHETGIVWACQFDEQSTVVCTDTTVTNGQVFAVDGTTGKVLWLLPDPRANRIAPTVTAVYDGKVYGTTQYGAVVLDAHTGKDVNDSVGIAPLVVNSYVGIAYDQATKVMEAYPASP